MVSLLKMPETESRFTPQISPALEQDERDIAIDIRDLDFAYGTNQVLRDVKIEIPPRAVTAFIGPSGCGKTTLLRCINRMNDLIDGARITRGSMRMRFSRPSPVCTSAAAAPMRSWR